jgi:Ca2+-binding RTX toxin-like protein
VFGNGGNDTYNVGTSGGVTDIGGQGNDSIAFGFASEANLVFGNEGSDSLSASGGAGANTLFGGQGDDTILGGVGSETIQGNEGNDTIRTSGGFGGIDTIAGGTGRDVFHYTDPDEDGDNAAGGGPVELITDVNWADDRFRTPTTVNFAANFSGATTGTDLVGHANTAIAGAFALATGSGIALPVVAAQFTFNGRAYLAIDNQSAGLTGQFDDATDLLLDITGVTGTIAMSNFI